MRLISLFLTSSAVFCVYFLAVSFLSRNELPSPEKCMQTLFAPGTPNINSIKNVRTLAAELKTLFPPEWAYHGLGQRLPMRNPCFNMTLHEGYRITCVPYFIIAGTWKSGTTSIYFHLKKHKDVAVSTKKEVHFFTTTFHQGLDWYSQFMPPFHTVLPDKIVGEATPGYYFFPQALARIYFTLPNVRLIVTMRDPVERAVSAMLSREGKESLPMGRAFRREVEVIEQCVRLVDADFKSAYRTCFRDIATSVLQNERSIESVFYVLPGLYYYALETMTYYFPRHQLLFLSGEELFEGDGVERIERFLGITFTNSTLVTRGAAPKEQWNNATERILDELRDFYRPHNEYLFELLGVNYGWNEKKGLPKRAED